MSRIKCPKCRSADVEHIGGKTKTTLNLNPFKPFTLTNHVPTGKQDFHCRKCGNVFKAKI